MWSRRKLDRLVAPSPRSSCYLPKSKGVLTRSRTTQKASVGSVQKAEQTGRMRRQRWEDADEADQAGGAGGLPGCTGQRRNLQQGGGAPLRATNLATGTTRGRRGD